jgi:hypothetical protein
MHLAAKRTLFGRRVGTHCPRDDSHIKSGQMRVDLILETALGVEDQSQGGGTLPRQAFLDPTKAPKHD